MAENIKKELKFFVLTEYEEEEEYLNKKHKEGWKLKKVVLPGIYYFEKCEPQDVVYRLDFNPQQKEDVESYHKMFEDYGWEYLQDLNEYSYFRKPAESSEKEQSKEDIFCDNESRMDMLKRIISRKCIPMIILFLCAVFPSIFHYGYIPNAENRGFLDGLFYGIESGAIIIIALNCLVFAKIIAGYIKLTKKYKTE